MNAYYNENDAYAAQWLRNLIDAGHIMRGDVDNRSIHDITANDLAGYTRCHFFAGIAGWDYALQLAGWPDDLPVWTGSCPCQPFSQISRKGRGLADGRHLWPVWARLIGECRPPVVFGEQVGSPAGRQWFDGVCTDMEENNYACTAFDLPAGCVNAPHKRQRIFWVGVSIRAGLEGYSGHVANFDQPRWFGAQEDGPVTETGCTDSWDHFDDAWDSEGTKKRVEPGTFPMAHGVPNRVDKLRAYGNAIVPQLAAEFIKAFMEATQ